jgi:hypothetical protein
MRGTGRTTNQIRSAPQGAIYAWCNEHTRYASDLAVKLGRKDVRIVPRSWVVRGYGRGLDMSKVILDHAFTARMTGPLARAARGLRS